MTLIHFWLPEHPDRHLGRWDPDRDPRRFEDGVGRAAVELYRRLAMEEKAVSIGPAVPLGARLVVIAAKSLAGSRGRVDAALQAIRHVHGRFVLVRGDIPSRWTFPIRPLIEFVPSPSRVSFPGQRWLPELPQAGLSPRRAERRGRIASVAFKGNPENVPPELLEDRWLAALEERGLSWWLDVPRDGGGPDQAWHEYGEVDVSLCLRHPRWTDLGRKPPGKLINAWLGGAVPIAGREPGFLDIGREGEDVLFADSAWQSLELIDELRADPGRLRDMERAIERRAAEFQPASILAAWWDALEEAVALAGRWRAPRRLERRLAPSAARLTLPLRTLAKQARRQAGRARRWRPRPR